MTIKPARRQVQELGEKLPAFLDIYAPGELEAILFLDPSGKIGYAPGPDAPAGCITIMNRAGVDRLMVLHAYTPLDLARDPGREAFAELIFENSWSS
ncbi:hypothetical protein Lfu02_80720 [Longispora fulva]|uniref:Uncharacterized protein n=1 Tax=Longispora fulva TaxID=619741 RepID=A0A8J7GIC4_9ACTN|nr:hypothetical protein [Longispora fulva]MBG6134188.1 hypothetical protein [Longispora fulva]MBG6137227.1 hypothetical protein [Longispora fulva]GIG63700.1 hypothetical protein Lfu02_80720 [Longispora fulva]